VAGGFVAGIAAYWLVKKTRANKDDADIPMYRTALRFGAGVMIVAGVGIILTGDMQAKLMFKQQPIKMAAAEGLVDTVSGAPFSLLTIGNLAGDDPASVKHIIEIPKLLSYLADGNTNSEVKGLTQLQTEYAAKYDPNATYRPNLAVTYWSFRLMIGFAVFAAATALAGLWLSRKGKITNQKWFSKLAVWSIAAPYLGASFGWIFTEMGRQPFVVAPNPSAFADGVDQVYLLTQHGVSKAVDAWEVGLSMVVFTLLYAVLAIFWYRLIVRYAQEGAPQVTEPVVSEDADAPLSFAY